ncbi:putative anti-sigma regulatory factor [Carbonactinospora thermoautotrophica]|nr:ATP-binding protein [Carbonactinospora thermoautotrophica]KWW98652.1 putative anti-sigma regulatory factor [Carbonactinospora thermoautotrophica]
MQSAVKYPPRPDMAGLVRRHVAGYVAWRGLTHRYAVDEVQLVATELFANAVAHARHQGRPIRVAVEHRGDVLRIEVHDPDPTPPAPRWMPDRTYGRGLLLVEALASRWGTVPAPDGGKLVYAEFRAVRR